VNIAVDPNPDGTPRTIYLIDWEGSDIGLTGTDVGYLAAWINSSKQDPQLGNKERSNFELVWHHFLQEYRNQVPVTEELARRATIHYGVSKVLAESPIMQQLLWGKQEMQLGRKLALEGLIILIEGYHGHQNILGDAFNCL